MLSSSDRLKSRTSAAVRVKVFLSPLLPWIAGGILATYLRADSKPEEREDGCPFVGVALLGRAGATGGGYEASTLLSVYRSRRVWMSFTRNGVDGSFMWKKPGTLMTRAKSFTAGSVPKCAARVSWAGVNWSRASPETSWK